MAEKKRGFLAEALRRISRPVRTAGAGVLSLGQQMLDPSLRGDPSKMSREELARVSQKFDKPWNALLTKEEKQETMSQSPVEAGLRQTAGLASLVIPAGATAKTAIGLGGLAGGLSSVAEKEDVLSGVAGGLVGGGIGYGLGKLPGMLRKGGGKVSKFGKGVSEIGEGLSTKTTMTPATRAQSIVSGKTTESVTRTVKELTEELPEILVKPKGIKTGVSRSKVVEKYLGDIQGGVEGKLFSVEKDYNVASDALKSLVQENPRSIKFEDIYDEVASRLKYKKGAAASQTLDDELTRILDFATPEGDVDMRDLSNVVGELKTDLAKVRATRGVGGTVAMTNQNTAKEAVLDVLDDTFKKYYKQSEPLLNAMGISREAHETLIPLYTKKSAAVPGLSTTRTSRTVPDSITTRMTPAKTTIARQQTPASMGFGMVGGALEKFGAGLGGIPGISGTAQKALQRGGREVGVQAFTAPGQEPSQAMPGIGGGQEPQQLSQQDYWLKKMQLEMISSQYPEYRGQIAVAQQMLDSQLGGGAGGGRTTEKQRTVGSAIEGMREIEGMLAAGTKTGPISKAKGGIAAFVGMPTAETELDVTLEHVNSLIKNAFLGSGMSEVELKSLDLPKSSDQEETLMLKLQSLRRRLEGLT